MGSLWRFIKKLLFVLFCLLLLLLVGAVIFILTFDLNHYKNFTEQKISAVLGRPVTIDSMETKVALVPTITIKGFKILNNEPFKDKAPLLFVHQMDAELELAPLLNYQINIHSVDVDKAEINMFQSATDNNWTVKSKDGDKTATVKADAKKNTKATDNIRLNVVNIKDLSVIYDNKGQKKEFGFNGLELKQFQMLKGSMVYNKQTFGINLNAGTLFDFLHQSPNFPFDLKIRSKLLNFSANGKVGNLKDLSGLQTTLSVQTKNLKNLLEFFSVRNSLIPVYAAGFQIQLDGTIDKLNISSYSGNINSEKELKISGSGTLENVLSQPVFSGLFDMQLFDGKLAEFWSVQPIALSGDIVASKKYIKAKKIVVDANRSDAQMAFNIEEKGKIYDVALSLSSDYLSLYDFIKRKNGAQATKTSTNNGKEKQIALPWDVLNQFNLKANIDIRHLQTSDLFVEPVGISSKPTLSDGVLKVPFDALALQGKVNGKMNADAHKKSLVFSAQGSHLNLNGIRPLQKEVKDVVLDANVSLNAKGETVQQVLKSVSGRIILQTSQGEIVNNGLFADLPKVLNLNKRKQAVDFSNTDNRVLITCGAADISVRRGVIQGNNQVALETNILNLLAGGRVDLNKQNMDVELHPSLPEGEKANEVLSIGKYIRVSGPFNKLSPKVDMEKVTTNLIQAGVDKLMGTQQKEKSTSSATTYTKGSLCKTVLGKDAIKQTKEKTTAVGKSNTGKTQNVAPKDDKKAFQKQLLNSLFQALDTQ